MTKINQIHSTIKFTYEVSQTELTFLDTTLYKGERFDTSQILDVRTHINQQTAIHLRYLIPTINTISKGEANRYLRTNSNKREFQNMKQKLTDSYKEAMNKQILPHINLVKFNQR